MFKFFKKSAPAAPAASAAPDEQFKKAHERAKEQAAKAANTLKGRQDTELSILLHKQEIDRLQRQTKADINKVKNIQASIESYLDELDGLNKNADELEDELNNL